MQGRYHPDTPAVTRCTAVHPTKKNANRTISVHKYQRIEEQVLGLTKHVAMLFSNAPLIFETLTFDSALQLLVHVDCLSVFLAKHPQSQLRVSDVRGITCIVGVPSIHQATHPRSAARSSKGIATVASYTLTTPTHSHLALLQSNTISVGTANSVCMVCTSRPNRDNYFTDSRAKP